MRKSHLLLATASVVLLSACESGNKSAVNPDLLKDLELASSADGINLGNASASSQQFVSSIERTTPPARAVAKSAPVKRHKPAPKAPPQVVRTEAPAAVSESEPSEVRMVFTPIESDAPITPRPQPVAVSYPSGTSSGGSDGSVGNGSATGAVLGTIFGVVLRGGGAGVDHCDPRVDGRRSSGTRISINNRMPFPTGTRPGLGRVAIGGRSGGDITSRFPH
jgi:hypothetical protein